VTGGFFDDRTVATLVSEGDAHSGFRDENGIIPVAFTQNSRDEVRVIGEDGEVAGSLSAESGTHQTTYLAFDTTQVTIKTNRSNPKVGDPCHTLAKGSDAPAICIKGAAIGRKPENGPQRGEILEDGSSYTLNATEQHAVAIQNATRGQDQNGLGISEDGTMYTLDQGSQHAVAWNIQDQNTGKSIKAKPSDIGTCLGTRDLSKYQGTFNADGIQSSMQVRRLTPVECARLQGVGDTHLDIIYKGKPLADSAKYKLLGNGFAVPVVKYIGTRIQMVEDLINASTS